MVKWHAIYSSDTIIVQREVLSTSRQKMANCVKISRSIDASLAHSILSSKRVHKRTIIYRHILSNNYAQIADSDQII